MPGRWTALAIVVFWLVMMGWLVGRELWMHFGPPPRLEDSLQAAARDGPTLWNISHNYERIGWAETQVIDQGQGRYQLRQHVHFDKASHFFQLTGLPLASLLPGAADVKGDARLTFDLTAKGDLDQLRIDILHDDRDLVLQIQGKPEGSELKLHVTSPLLSGFHWDFAIPYDARNVVHNSLCPFDRMPNLWPGRRWQAPMVDPAKSMMSQVLHRAPVEVTVRDEPQNFHWSALRDWVSCLVVDAHQPEQEMHIEIWVHQQDGRVLKQRARWGKITLDIERKTVSPAEQRILDGE
jgi:hypothetical protein